MWSWSCLADMPRTGMLVLHCQRALDTLYAQPSMQVPQVGVPVDWVGDLVQDL